MCEKQQGATVTFGTSAGTWECVNIGRYNAPIPVIDNTHLGTTGKRKKCPGQLEDPQIFTVTLRNKGSQAYPAKGLVQTITVTSPLGTYTTAESVAGTGFVVDIRHPEFGSDTEALTTIEVDIQFDSATGPTRTLAT